MNESVFRPLRQDRNLKRAIIVDLDQTLSLYDGKRNYDDIDECEFDSLNEPVAKVVSLFANDGVQIVFCSGRDERYRKATVRFLEKHFSELEYKLLLRRENDLRKDTVVKEEIYKKEIEGKYYVSFVMEDRISVVKMWRSLGLVCFQVCDGDY